MSPAAPWQRALHEAIDDLGELLSELGLEDGCAGGSEGSHQAMRQLPLLVPRSFVARMGRGDPLDPLLRQVLPSERELGAADGFSCDPLGECSRLEPDGTLQKYRGRVLLAATSRCAIHCRYCFRRNLRVGEPEGAVDGFRPAVERIAADPEIEEVILSGGDPLTLDDARLGELVRELAGIPHLRRLRVHTRMPVVIPERVDQNLLDWLCGTRLAPVVVVHTNHPREIDGSVARALGALRDAGIAVLNQSVLLQGVNDDLATLSDLSRRLFECGVLPYYLHLLDRVRGAAHFEVDEGSARILIGELSATLPGYLVPRLVREIEGAPSKVPVIL